MEIGIRLEFQHVSAHAAIVFSETAGVVMDCQAIEKYDSPARSWSRRWAGAASGLLRRLQPGYPKLDLGAMSDYMKRDMGFMDGRDPRQDSDLTR